MTPDDLAARLAALEARVPVDAGPPALDPRPRRRRLALAAVAAPALVLAIGASALAGAAVIQMVTTSGGSTLASPVADAGLECMTPPEAAAWLAAHGYGNVAWDTNAGHGTIDAGAIPGDELPEITEDAIPGGVPVPPPAAGEAPPLPANRSTTPPAAGLVIPGPMIDGQLVMFVDVTPGATRPPSCDDGGRP